MRLAEREHGVGVHAHEEVGEIPSFVSFVLFSISTCGSQRVPHVVPIFFFAVGNLSTRDAKIDSTRVSAVSRIARLFL